MPSTHQSVLINTSIDEIWNKFSDFHALPWATNVISSVEKVGNIGGDQVGAKRVLNGVFHETLIKVDTDNYRIEYSIDDGPSPVSKHEVSDYIGAIQLSPAEDSEGTLVVWASSWESRSDNAVEFCSGIYVALLNELVSSFE